MRGQGPASLAFLVVARLRSGIRDESEDACGAAARPGYVEPEPYGWQQDGSLLFCLPSSATIPDRERRRNTGNRCATLAFVLISIHCYPQVIEPASWQRCCQRPPVHCAVRILPFHVPIQNPSVRDRDGKKVMFCFPVPPFQAQVENSRTVSGNGRKRACLCCCIP